MIEELNLEDSYNISGPDQNNNKHSIVRNANQILMRMWYFKNKKKYQAEASPQQKRCPEKSVMFLFPAEKS